MTSPGDEGMELELVVMMRRLDIDVPADLASGVLHGYRSLRQMTALLRAGPAGAIAGSDGGLGPESSSA